MTKKEILNYIENEINYFDTRIRELDDHTDYTTGMLNWLEWLKAEIEKDKNLDWVLKLNPMNENTGTEQEIIYTLQEYVKSNKQ